MPYNHNDDLPDSIKNHLPDHAKSIFRKAFNNAYEQYQNEESAFRVAWAAVKKQYEKNDDGIWVERA